MSALYRKQKFHRRMAMLLLIVILNETLAPTVALALTGGPSQPEMHGFEPVSTSDMVDLFTGDFKYNIPLMDAGGYPINISYQAGASADDEGSWVGLGWSLTPGAMNRDMRGLPDDFKGDKITKEFNIRPDVTTGINAGATFQILGLYKKKTKTKSKDLLSLGVNAGGFFNTYRGYGVEYGVSPAFSLGKVVSNANNTSDTLHSFNVSASLKYNSQSGLDADLSVGVGDIGLQKTAHRMSGKANVAIGINSRQGLKDLTFDTKYNKASSKGMGNAGSFGGSLSFGSRTYVPTNALPMVNTSNTFHGTLGTEWWSTHPSFQLTGYKTTQELRVKSQEQAAYGYFHSQTAQNDRSALMDYNKEKQGAYRPSQPNLGLSVGTYDLFSATGQGVSGQFRAMRNDVGTFRTPNHTNSSQATNLGAEIGLAQKIHGGADIQRTKVETTAGDWDNGKGAATHLSFTEQSGAAVSAAYEPVFVKNTSESAPTNSADFRTAIGDNTPIALKIGRNRGVFAENALRKEANNGNTAAALPAFTKNIQRDKREKRSQVFSYLTAAEAAKVGLDKKIKTYPLNTPPSVNPTELARTDRPAHHISEVTVTQGDGSRYVYGIPAYNVAQEEATFAVNSGSPKSGSLIRYSANTDNSVRNNQGRDWYYDAQKLPPYAHSYLLTGIVSSDYVDVTNNGITDDDIGTNVKINYTKVHSNYGWRTPYTENYARHNEGYRTDSRDDKASYVHGQKEIWYTHSIETKTMVARFYLSDRQDGLGVSDRNGKKDWSKPLKRLDKIELYSKSELAAKTTAAVPIKTVHFVYDYSLCAGIQNHVSNGGKLTLRKIYFTYGNNTSGALNAYRFNYNGDKSGRKFTYSLDNYDRWGSIKETTANLNGISNQYFPYATQNKTLADDYAKGWNLTKIELPSGGQIDVKYESDDYAYVQDKRAGQMLGIKGFSRTPTATPDGLLYEKTPPSVPIFGRPSKYVHVDISGQVPTDIEDFKKRYLENVNQIYFQCLVNLKGSSSEYIKGYFNINYSESITLSSDRKTAIIPIAMTSTGINPICKIALQTMRLELPSLVYPSYEDQSNQTESSIKKSLGKVLGIFPEIMRMGMGFDNYAVTQSWAMSVNAPQSWLRLANPNFKKLGGGARVAEISVTNFANFTTETAQPNNAKYGQRYFYTTTNPLDGQPMSSGVAAYEPMIGNEENLFREPVTYDEKVRLAPDNSYYMEKPFGESLFPAPSVGYSSVRVENIEPANLKHTGTGYTIHEFFTAKDFPTVVDQTSKQHEKSPGHSATFKLTDFFKLNKRQHVGVSQGYTIEVNDMHGKPKAEYIRNAAGADIAWTKYAYRTDGANRLVNDGISVINTEGVIGTGTIGYDFDIWHDMQQDKTVTNSFGMSTNGELFTIPFTVIPIFIPAFIPKIHREESVFRSAVTTKFVKRFAVLDKVTKMENGSTVSTENLLFDSETGQPLLTKTQNEYRDDIYQFSYPAHWAYEEGMGQAYKNIGLRANNVGIGSSGLEAGEIPQTFKDYFVAGDELIAEQNGNLLPNRYHVALIGGKKRVIDPIGNYLAAGNYDLKIMRSGRRNQAGATIGSVVSRKDPRQNGRLVFDSQILSAQAATFKDEWAVNTGKTEVCTVTNSYTDTDKTNDAQVRQLMNNISVPTTYTPVPTTLGQVMNNPNLFSFLNYTNAASMPCGWETINVTDCPPPNTNGPLVIYFKLVSFYVKLSADCTLKIYGYAYDCRNGKIGRYHGEYLLPQYATLNCLTPKANCVVNCATPVSAGQQVNPYQLGIKGNWRPNAAYALYTQRTAPLSRTSKNLRTDGDIVGYNDFWSWTNNKLTPRNVTQNDKWVKTNTIMHYDDKGNDIENKDALNIFSSALFRYQNTLASAVAANARRREIAFDGFEDYGFTYNYVEGESSIPKTPTEICGIDHFDFALGEKIVQRDKISSAKAHTGRFSFQMAANSNYTKKVEFNPANILNNDNDDDNTPVVDAADNRIVRRVLPRFTLAKDKSFVLSAWVSKVGSCTPTDMVGIQMRLVLTYTDNTTAVVLCKPSGAIVEEWQRIETVFNTGAKDVKTMTIEFTNGTGSVAFMDDLRILPADGKMKSFVYDARNLRLMAQLDENNYATFYEYDDEGTLVRTKRETERGIVTIQENRSTLFRRQSQGNIIENQ